MVSAVSIQIQAPSDVPPSHAPINTKRMTPGTTRRGQDSVRLLEIDGRTGAFLVPTKLLRAGKLKLKRIETDGRASRAGPAAARVQFELTREQRTELELKCRHH